MSHAHDHLYAYDRPACGREYAAYGAEADALNHLSAGRFVPLLDELITARGLQTPAQYLAFVRDHHKLAAMIDGIEAGLGEAPALSMAERQMRDGFYAVAIGEQIGVRAGLDEAGRCEAMATLIPVLSLY